MEPWTCAICGETIDEDDAEALDLNTGTVHGECLEEWESDEPNRAADYYHDQRYDR